MPSKSSRSGYASDETGYATSLVTLACFLGVVLIGSLTPAAPWALQHGLLFLAVALLMILFPAKVRLPRIWWIAGGLFLLFGLAPLLPAAWFGMPGWRKELESLGVATGPHVAVQWRQALEQYGVFVLMLVTGLWLGGHRVSPNQTRNLAFAFTISIAIYALLSQFLGKALPVSTYSGHFGFFPNRNHSGTFLAMGVICGLGVLLHSVRKKDFWRLGISLVATGICLWAVFSWSISRAGVLLCGIGLIIWLVLLGKNYWRANELKALGLLLLLGGGTFLVAESRVKDRIAATADRVSEATTGEQAAATDSVDLVNLVDFRVPIGLDAWDMIAEAPLTGVGAGQFRYVFPQYRTRSSPANNAECLHPENDWLWMTAELGIPATGMLAVLVVSAFVHGFRIIAGGRDRALRFGCLVAAMIVPIHGCFDVPGHRPPLAWAAVFLFVISLNPSSNIRSLGRVRWLWRAVGLVLGVAGLRLMGTHGLGLPSPFIVQARQQLDEGQALYRGIVAPGERLSFQEIRSRRQELAEKARAALRIAPLERQLYLLEGLALMPLENEWSGIDRAFSVDRKLAPLWVRVPFIQSAAWLTRDPDRTVELWKEAVRRADQVDKFVANRRSFRVVMEASIRRLAKRNPALRDRVEEAIAVKMPND